MGGGGGLRESQGSVPRARSRLPRAGPCVGGVQPVLKPVVALAGDVAELGPEAVVINDQLLLAGLSGDVDGLGLPLPHAGWGRHMLAAEEVWLVSTRVPNSWDRQYWGPPRCRRSARWHAGSGRSM